MWALLVLMYVNSAVPIQETPVTFDTFETCQKFGKMYKDSYYNTPSVKVDFICVPVKQ